MNTSDNANKINPRGVEGQQKFGLDSPLDTTKLKQLSQAHGARVWGKSIELMLQEGITAVPRSSGYR